MAGNDVSPGGRSRTILWCVPRSGSTALTKCLSFIDGIEVWFEPYCYCRSVSEAAKRRLDLYLPPDYAGNEDKYRQAADLFDQICHCKSNPEHFSLARVKSFLEASSFQHVFVKDIGYKLDRKDYGFLPEGYTHTFLIRHPLRAFASYRKAIYRQYSVLGILTEEGVDEENFDIGGNYSFMASAGLMFKDLYDIWKFVSINSGSTPIVIDGDELMSNLAEILPKYCRAVGLPYSESLLKWDASTKVVNDWMIPAGDLIGNLAHIYKRAVKSSEFIPPSPMPDRSQVTPDVIRCADQNIDYYNEMYNSRIKIQC